MSLQSMLRHRCTIQRNTSTNVNGVLTPSWSTIDTGVPCLVQEGAGRVRSTSAGFGLEFDAIGFFMPWVNLRPQGNHDAGDRILMTLPASPGTTYLVLKAGDEAGQGTHLEVYLQRVPAKT